MFERVKKVVSDWLYGPEKTITKTPVVIDKSQHHIDPKLVSFGARRTCELLQAKGYKAYIVGGAVRDLLLGVQPKDFDVATDATPEQVKRCQRRAFIIGRRFRLVHVVFRDEIIECSTFRALDAQGVRKDANGRVISDNVFGEMWEDAARRDFTINALYYDPITEKVFDYHGGFKDIQRKELRMIGEPVDRYREDPVRMMRAVRISTKLGFSMERETEKAIPKMARLLENVPAARLFDEMMKLFTCGHAEACLLKLREEGLHRSLLPMLDVMFEEPGGEKFLLLALKRTDERIAIGKKISPAFLFASLLWPQVKERWNAYQKRPGMYRARALYAAADDVLATQCQKLAIQNRFLADMKLIWMLQLRFERCTGKNPYSLVRHPKYRAGYDFMLLRSLVGDVAPERVRWWELFVDATPEERESMIAEQEMLARRTGDQAREGQRRKLADEEALMAEVEEIAANGGRKPRPWEARISVPALSSDMETEASDELPQEKEQLVPNPESAAGEGLSRSARRRRRRRERIARAKEEARSQVSDVSAESAAQEEDADNESVGSSVQQKVPVSVAALPAPAPIAQLVRPVEHTIVSSSGETLVQVETAKPVAQSASVPEVTTSERSTLPKEDNDPTHNKLHMQEQAEQKSVEEPKNEAATSSEEKQPAAKPSKPRKPRVKKTAAKPRAKKTQAAPKESAAAPNAPDAAVVQEVKSVPTEQTATGPDAKTETSSLAPKKTVRKRKTTTSVKKTSTAKPKKSVEKSSQKSKSLVRSTVVVRKPRQSKTAKTSAEVVISTQSDVSAS